MKGLVLTNQRKSDKKQKACTEVPYTLRNLFCKIVKKKLASQNYRGFHFRKCVHVHVACLTLRPVTDKFVKGLVFTNQRKSKSVACLILRPVTDKFYSFCFRECKLTRNTQKLTHRENFNAYGITPSIKPPIIPIALQRGCDVIG